MKRAQAWGFDLTIASIIFIGGILIFYFFSLNYPQEGADNLESMQYQGEIITDNLLSEGEPQSWNETNVVIIGILSNNRINETKLEKFYNLSEIIPGGYSSSKALFKTRYEYFFNLSESIIINGEAIPGIGNEPQNPENLVKVTRFTVYQDRPVTLSLFVWE